MRALLSLDAGAEQRDLGLFATELNNSDYVAMARHVAIDLCEKHGSVTVDMVRADPRLKDLQPSSSHVYGCLFLVKGFRCIGMEPSKVKTNRARRILRWTWQP